MQSGADLLNVWVYFSKRTKHQEVRSTEVFAGLKKQRSEIDPKVAWRLITLFELWEEIFCDECSSFILWYGVQSIFTKGFYSCFVDFSIVEQF